MTWGITSCIYSWKYVSDWPRKRR